MILSALFRIKRSSTENDVSESPKSSRRYELKDEILTTNQDLLKSQRDLKRRRRNNSTDLSRSKSRITVGQDISDEENPSLGQILKVQRYLDRHEIEE